ncbi:MAG: acyl carrier protein [Roseiarcus sp.]
MEETKIYLALDEIFQDFFADSTLALRPETTARDVPGWDSLNHLSLMIAVESRFGIRLTTAEIEKLTRVGDLAAVIAAKLGDAGARARSSH